MFSQLCRVNPRTLWDKIAARQRSVDANEEEPRCQLEHCTFCDHRVERESFHKEVQYIQSTDTCLEATENPAYGLSTKHWLEIKEEGEENEVNLPTVLNETMESPSTDANQEQDSNTDLLNPNLQTSLQKSTSQHDADCDGDTMNPSQSYGNQMSMETRHKRIEPPSEKSKSDFQKSNDQKHHGGLTWSVLKHRQTETLENCDKPNPSVIEHSISDKLLFDSKLDSSQEQADNTQLKRSVKDRSFPLSLMRPIAKIADKKSEQQQIVQKVDISRQRPIQRGKFAPVANQSRRFPADVLGVNSNPLSAIEQIKTEESIQEWLARIGESTNSIDGDENRLAWEPNHSETTKSKLRTEATNVLNKGLQEALEMSHGKSFPAPKQTPNNPEYHDETLLPEDENLDTAELLCNASKASPANIPMVVMQCSRLHSHIGSKPPFQQTSLPMGTLVTALYQESDWLYVQTPHGVEGFIIASNCVPIGTMNDSAHTSRRPWEPCDFPIEINVRRQCEFGRQPQGAYIPAKLPTNKHTSPYVSTVKMKTNFYSDRYFSHTFKSKDSIKTAKTVTDILRNSPETKVSNQ